MEARKYVLLRVLNNVMFNTTNLIGQVLNYNTEINDKDISNAEQAYELLQNLNILKELPF